MSAVAFLLEYGSQVFLEDTDLQMVELQSLILFQWPLQCRQSLFLLDTPLRVRRILKKYPIMNKRSARIFICLPVSKFCLAQTPSNLSYSPYSAHPTNIPHAPQPSYVNQQRQPNSYAMTDTPVQYNQQTQQKVPTPPQHVQPSMQARMPNMSRPSQQALTQAPTRAMQATALTQAQLENYRLLQHNKDHLRQTTTASQPNVRNAAFNPHYPFIPHFQNSPHPASTPSQQMPGNQAQVNGQRRQGGTQSFTGAGSFRVAEWQSAQKSVPTVTSPAPAAMTNSGMCNFPDRYLTCTYWIQATSVASALDGALVQVPSNNAQTVCGPWNISILFFD